MIRLNVHFGSWTASDNQTWEFVEMRWSEMKLSEVASFIDAIS